MSLATAHALLMANVRFWPTVLPEVRRGLRTWERQALAIPDAALREQALWKLREERFNTEVAATLATLVPPVRRLQAIEAIVALQVIYDYLDGLTEQPVPKPLDAGRQLYRAFADALTPLGPPVDHYRRHPGEDGGYVQALVAAGRRAFWSLPAAPAVAPVARAVAARCGEAQTRTHAIPLLGAGQLRAWAQAQPEAERMRWWEVASGAAASVLALHALVALAADPATVPADAERLAAAYVATCALTTLLDSLVDGEEDARRGGHAYLAYYRDETEATERLGALAREAAGTAAGLPRAAHHLVTVAGAVAFYLSAPGAGGERARRLTAPMAAELQPLLAPALAIFGAWRRGKRWHEAPRLALRPSLRRRRTAPTTERGSVEDGAMTAVSYGGMERPIPGTMAPCRPPPAHPPASPSPPSAARPPAAPPRALSRRRARSPTSSSATGSSSAPPACAR